MVNEVLSVRVVVTAEIEQVDSPDPDTVQVCVLGAAAVQAVQVSRSVQVSVVGGTPNDPATISDVSTGALVVKFNACTSVRVRCNIPIRGSVAAAEAPSAFNALMSPFVVKYPS